MSSHLRRVRLLFHIGAGKTGTSSIQATLKANREALEAAGYLYLGLMWEHAPTRLHPWQVFGGHDAFLALPRDVAEPQFRQLLRATVDDARSKGIHTLIWSSESFFDRYDSVLAPLAEIRAANVDVEVLAYVRNHGSWARSAYVQWGIKHKTMAGPILPFREWVARRLPAFAPTLQRYAQALPGALRLRNFDAAQDVVDDFQKVVGFPPELLAQRVNDNATPGNVDLLMRALFNGAIRAPVFPMLYDRQVGQYLSADRSADQFLGRLFPTAQDIVDVVLQTADDRAAISALLTAQGQPPLQAPVDPPKEPQVDEQALLLALAGLVISQARRLDVIETRLASAAEAPKARL